MKKYLKQVVLILLLAAIIVALRYSGLGGYLTLENLKRHQGFLEQTVHAHYVWSVLLYVLFYMVSTALAIPGALVLTLAGGLLFHTLPGVIYVNIGATTGAILAFLLSRYILGNWLQERYAAQLERFNSELDRDGYLYLLTVRLIPVFPFFLINLLSGLTRISLRTFAWTTAAGILPASLVYSFAGSQIGTIQTPRDIISPRILAALVLLGLLSLVPVMWKKLRPVRH